MAKASKFDAADYLKSPQAIADYLSEAFETGDEKFIAEALGTVARAKGMAGIATKPVCPGRASIVRSAAKAAPSWPPR